jgi:hypothetical protein
MKCISVSRDALNVFEFDTLDDLYISLGGTKMYGVYLLDSSRAPTTWKTVTDGERYTLCGRDFNTRKCKKISFRIADVDKNFLVHECNIIEIDEKACFIQTLLDIGYTLHQEEDITIAEREGGNPIYIV